MARDDAGGAVGGLAEGIRRAAGLVGLGSSAGRGGEAVAGSSPATASTPLHDVEGLVHGHAASALQDGRVLRQPGRRVQRVRLEDRVAGEGRAGDIAHLAVAPDHLGRGRERVAAVLDGPAELRVPAVPCLHDASLLLVRLGHASAAVEQHEVRHRYLLPGLFGLSRHPYDERGLPVSTAAGRETYRAAMAVRRVIVDHVLFVVEDLDASRRLYTA